MRGNIGAADGFLCTVNGKDGDFWIVSPKITESDGTPHPKIRCIAVTGLTPAIDSDVMVVTIRNNHDGGFAPRYINPSESNGIIVGVKTGNEFAFTGNYTFDGSVNVTEDLTVGGDLEVTGQVKCASLIINGVNFTAHTHAAGALTSPSGAVTGVTGGVS